MRVDAHQHFWELQNGRYSWLARAGLEPIRRDFGPADLAPHLRDTGVDRTIVVQAENSYADTDAMLRHADRCEWVAAVVGWVPLLEPPAAEQALDRYLAHPAFRGVRHLVHDEPDPDWLRRGAVAESLGLLSERGLVFEIPAVFPRHLVLIPSLAEQFPGLEIVIDHLGKPAIASGELEPWAAQLAATAAYENVYAKVSGLGTDAGPEGWSSNDLRPFVEVAAECFGPDRLMLGSDWPVCLLSGDYEFVWDQTAASLGELAPGAREAVLGGTAARLYGVRA